MGGAELTTMQRMSMEAWATILLSAVFIVYTVIHFNRADKLQFSFRTLLLAVTAFAVVLGLVMWAEQ